MMMPIPRGAKRPVLTLRLHFTWVKQQREDRTSLCTLIYGAKVFGNIANIHWLGSHGGLQTPARDSEIMKSLSVPLWEIGH